MRQSVYGRLAGYEDVNDACRSRLLNASMKALSLGLPGLEKSSSTLFR
jgi:hypothetical protein